MMPTLLITLGAVLVALIILWVVSLLIRDASIVDPFWGLGYLIVAWIAYGINAPGSTRLLLICVLISIWGVRLSGFLLIRNIGHGEDSRYQAMREKHGSQFWWVSLFTVFLLQGVLIWFISFPVQVVSFAAGDAPLSWLDYLGVAVWIIGFAFESGGDWQLARFRSDPANEDKVLDSGFWRYTRHPNYFGDSCQWWGIYLIAINGGGGWTILSPLLMTFLLLRVSGVSLLEKSIADRRPEYTEYKRRTSAFIPWPPKA